MNTKKRYVLIFALALFAGLALVTVTGAMPRNASLTPGGSPTVVAYQGEVQVSGTPYTGDGFFKFAVVNAAGDTAYWSNDGSSTGGGEPTAAVTLTVSNGLFSVLLGDTALGGMTQALTADVFSQPDRYLRVWFSTSVGGPFDQLTPDTRIAAVPYALQAQEAVDADTVDGLHASELGTHYQNVVIVAKSGGDYSSVQAAINSVADAAADNPYLVWVAPGMYSETVMLKPYVHLQGAGQEATVITSTASSVNFPPTEATLILASDASLRDLTVGNNGAGQYNVALLATVGVTRVLAADVTARTQGGGVNNYAIVLNGSGVGVTLQQVTALGENGGNANIGLVNQAGAATTLRGGSFTGCGGTLARGIFNYHSATLEAENVTALGENGSSTSYGLYNANVAMATLRDGSFTACEGTDARGIYNYGATLEAESVTVLGENGSNNFGLYNYDGATAILRSSSFTGRGGTDARGIFNYNSGTTLEAVSIIALAENASNVNVGLQNNDGAEVTLYGGSFTGRGGGGTYARGIYNSGSSTTLEAESVTALGENANSTNYGLYNNIGAAATLHGGSFTARGGTYARGIYNYDNDTTLAAESVTALGENGSDTNYGLHNYDGAATTLRGGFFTARAGTDAYGIHNDGISSTLETGSVTALGENGSNVNIGLLNDNVAAATLRGGSFIGRGGTHANGINNAGSDTTLEAESITALGENGNSNNNGLRNYATTTAVMLRGGAFTGRGGTSARGIFILGDAAMLTIESVTALGENASSSNYGLAMINSSTTVDVTQSVLEGVTNSVYYDNNGDVTVSNSRLVGGWVSGSVICVAVSQNTDFNAIGCP